MAVFVDPLMNHGWCFRGGSINSCHLFSDLPRAEGIRELVRFGRRIGLKREWLQARHDVTRVPHFDLTPGKRERAVAAGAVELTKLEAVNVWRRLRGDPPLRGATQKEAACPNSRAASSSVPAHRVAGVGVVHAERDNFGARPGKPSPEAPGRVDREADMERGTG